MGLSQKIDTECAQMRLRFHDDEAKFSWLPMLLDAYAIIDKGTTTAIKGEEERRNAKLSCKKGCDNCCRTHKDIPVYPLELVGIYWYCAEKIDQPVRETLKKQLLSHGNEMHCPFLINSSCLIYPIRPVSCRQFNVFNKPCDAGEDPYYTRRGDVLTPAQDYTNQAFLVMLPFYGITDEAEKLKAIKNNFIHTQVCNLQSYKWTGLIKAMEDFDSKNR